jgi:hypothetical protein
VKGRIIAVKSTGKRRSDAEWEKEYENSSVADEPDFETFKAELKEKPLSFGPALLIILVLALVPFIFMGFGAYMVTDYFLLKSNGSQTTATVVDIEQLDSDDGGYTYAPVLKFKDGRGVTHQYKDRVSTGGSSSYGVGEKVKVYYDPEKPSRFIIDSFWRYAGFGLIFFGMGFLVFSIFFGRLFLKLTGLEKEQSKDAVLKKSVEKIKRQHMQNQYYLSMNLPVRTDRECAWMMGIPIAGLRTSCRGRKLPC